MGIRMVSDSEGEQLRLEENERQNRIKSRLIGAKITGMVFYGIGITNHVLEELTLEKEGETFTVTIEAEQYYESIHKRLVVTDNQTKTEME